MRLCRLPRRPSSLYAETRALPDYARWQFDLEVMLAAEEGERERMHKDMRRIAGPDSKRDPMGVGRCIHILRTLLERLS